MAAIIHLDRNCHCICLKKPQDILITANQHHVIKLHLANERARQRSFLCVIRQYSQAQLCAAKQGVEEEKKAGKEAGLRGFRPQPSTSWHDGWVWGFGARSSSAYGTALRGLPEAAGHDKTMCVYKPDASKRRRSERGKCAGGRGRRVSQQPHTLCRDETLSRGAAILPRHFLEVT